MRQLIWKEWHEQGWKLIFFCIVLGALAGIGLHTRIIPDEEMIAIVCLPAIGILPLLTATGLVPAERDEGTLETLAALPISIRRVLKAKLLAGFVLCVVPLFWATVLSLCIAAGREKTAGWMIALYGKSTLSTAALFLWMFTMTVRLPSEARAAMVAIGITFIWGTISGVLVDLKLPPLDSISPFCFINAGMQESSRNDWGLFILDLIMEGIIAIVLWRIAARSIGKWEQLAE